jgi:hypothetical protein
MVTVAVFAGAGLLLLVLVVVAGNRVLRSDSPVSSGMADGLGNFIDVFDPVNARAARDLKEQDNVGHVIPSPDGDDPPHGVDLKAGRVTIRRA